MKISKLKKSVYELRLQQSALHSNDFPKEIERTLKRENVDIYQTQHYVHQLITPELEMYLKTFIEQLTFYDFRARKHSTKVRFFS